MPQLTKQVQREIKSHRVSKLLSPKSLSLPKKEVKLAEFGSKLLANVMNIFLEIFIKFSILLYRAVIYSIMLCEDTAVYGSSI